MVFKKYTSFSLHCVLENSKFIDLKEENGKIREPPVGLFQ
jgi:hypothetical protein